MAHEVVSMQSRNPFRYVPLLAAGVLVFLGLVLLGNLSGLRWHSLTFGWWVPLNPTILGPTGDWAAWFVSFLLSISPSVVPRAGRRTRWDTAVVVIFLVLPLLSLMAISWSPSIGGELLVGLGFLAAYALISRSQTLLGVERGSALRLVCSEVFAFLAIAAAGGAASVLVWQKGVFYALISGSDGGPLFTCLTVDMAAFYLARPFLSAMFVLLAVVAIVALFREPFQSITGVLVRRMTRGKHLAASGISVSPAPQSRKSIIVRRCLPYVILAASVLLGIVITTYPYTVTKVGVILGSDSWWYMQELGSTHTFADILPRLQADRGFFLLVLYLVRTVTGLETAFVVELMPALLSAVLAVSSFVLVREGTGRSWLAAFVALLSVVSAQTSLGMGAGILTNWFALSVANFMLALVVRSIRRRSTLSAAGALIVSFILLASFAFLWVVVIAELALVLFASIIAFRNVARREWKREVGSLGVVLVGSVLTPIALVFLVVMPLLGFRPLGLDVSAWLMMGWNYLVQGATPQVLGSALTALEEAFDFAGNRADLPFLTLLSIVGLLDQRSQHRPFRRIVSAMILVPAVITMITPSLYHTWRGMYIMPLYMTGALGVGSIVDRVNGQGASWRSPSRLAFAGTFAGYVFLAHLSYSLRALWLLILVAFRW